jgi:ABC-type sugar transport system permease subunit
MTDTAGIRGGQSERKKSPFQTANRKRTIFIIVMLAYPVFHFLFFWIFINFNSVALTFKGFFQTDPNDFELNETVTFFTFKNYGYWFNEFATNNKVQQMLLNSGSYAVLNLFVALPLSLLAAFVLFKKIPAHGFFRVMFFLPSIIPLAALVIAFMSLIEPNRGLVSLFLALFGVNNPPFMVTDLNKQIVIWVFCLWSGMGYNIILFSSAMARLPMEVLESGKLEGIKGIQELIRIYVPLIWPNITTMTMFALMATFGVAMQPMMISGNINNTIGLEIYSTSRNGNNLQTPATLGMICTLVAAPVILTIRHFMEKAFADVSF